MSVEQLTDRHFVLTGREKKSLSLQLRGNYVVLFKMQNCPGCREVEPILRQLATENQSVRFATIDVGIYKNVAGMSRQTSCPIQSVPYLILYVNGRPHAKPKNKDINSLRRFISESLRGVPPAQVQQQGFMQGQQYPPHQTQKVFNPEMDNNKQMRTSHGYSQLGGVEDEEEKFLTPAAITPHNKPWGRGYKHMDTLD